MFKIGYRTIKTALGTALAIYISQLLHLQNFASAGIITILCIQITQKRSLQAMGPLCGMLSGNCFFLSLFRAYWLPPVCDRSASFDIHSDNGSVKN